MGPRRSREVDGCRGPEEDVAESDMVAMAQAAAGTTRERGEDTQHSARLQHNLVTSATGSKKEMLTVSKPPNVHEMGRRNTE